MRPYAANQASAAGHGNVHLNSFLMRSIIRHPLFLFQLAAVAYIGFRLYDLASLLFSAPAPLLLPVVPVASYGQPTVLSPGVQVAVTESVLSIAQPSFWQRLFIPQADQMSIVQMLAGMAAAAFLLQASRRLDMTDFFRHDISRLLQLAALMFLTYFFCHYIGTHYAKQLVAEQTGEQYKLVRTFEHAVVWTAVALSWFARIFRKGVSLQQDQALTV